LTAEQLEASRAERMRLNGRGALTLEDARVWIEETGLCLFLPKRQFTSSIAPSFVEAIAGNRNSTPDPKHIALAEELLVRLETDGVAVRLNLLGQPGEQPDFVVAAWVLPYVYALRGDRDWRRSPQLTGSRQVSQLAVQTYKLLEAGDTTIPSLKHALGREVSETAVLRAITELWQQLRIIPVISAPGQTAKWQLLRTRFQKAIAEGASTSQVTAISVLASIYLQAVIAASMEEVEMFLAPLTARSKVREVLRGLVATRQVHTISLGHAPHFYVAGTLPEFAVATTAYSSSSMPASAYFLHSHEHDEEPYDRAGHDRAIHDRSIHDRTAQPPAPVTSLTPEPPVKAPEVHVPRIPAAHKPAAAANSSAARPHFSRPAAHSRDRKPAQPSSGSRTARRPGAESRSSSTRSASGRSANGARPASGARWNPKTATNGKRTGAHAASGSTNGALSNGNGSARNHASKAPAGIRNGKPSTAAINPRNGNGNGHRNGTKPTAKSGAAVRNGGLLRKAGAAPRKDARPDARTASRSLRSSSRKPALAAGAKAGNSKRYGFTAPARKPAGPSTKKRG
jgi:23S rRNA pseudouridine2605 synthase